MVLIDGTKYACQSCIKGHRSSKCTHTSRPLTEIKKKGRPTSQCTHCRELRKTKSVHGRCDCAAREAEQKPTPRILPNGLADAVATPEPDEPALTTTEPSGVTRLLNPCNCLRGGKCTCCTVVKRGAPKAFPQDADASPIASTSSGGCCSSNAPLTSEALLIEPEPSTPPPLDLSADIPVTSMPYFTPSSFAPSYPNTSAPPPPPASSINALFLPPTHGTHACFCGPTCGCVGCAVHDPYARKRPAPGACAGGGCRCGTERVCEGDAKRARVTPPGSVSVAGAGAGGCCGTSKSAAAAPAPAPVKSCCGSRGGKGATSAPAPPTTSGIELPSLWAHGAALASSAANPLPHLPAHTADLPLPTTSNPLPSLRTLYPALLDLELALPLPAYTSAPCVDPVTPLSASDETRSPPSAEGRGDCSAVYLQEPLDDACGSGAADGEGDGGGCHCSSQCGCRADADDGVDVDPEEGPDDGEGQDDGEMGRLAELAALGAFG
ncbi:hypothetical protein JCM3770_002454 [Rhodotorula araucariae]